MKLKKWFKNKLVPIVPKKWWKKTLKIRDHIKLYKDPILIRKRYLGEGVLRAAKKTIAYSAFPKVRILFYPNPPNPNSVIYKVCKINGYKIVSEELRKNDLCFKYEDSTFKEKFSKDEKSTNGKIKNISKKKVGHVFKEVFGYSINVEPTVYDENMVVKSNTNAVHLGQILEGPIKKEKVNSNKVYQKEVKNVTKSGYAIDNRLCICNGEPVIMYKKYRKKENRFSNSNEKVEIKKPQKVFKKLELKRLKKFSKKFNIDFAELDILRDVKNGRIYIVDVNDTPYGPPSELPMSSKRRALAKISKSFEKMVENITYYKL